MTKLRNLAFIVAFALPTAALAADPGEELDITSGAVTGLECALKAQKTGDLTLLQTCPLRAALKGIVVYDVTEELIIRIAPGVVPKYKLESAYGGGSIDLTGTVKKVAKNGIATLVVEEFSVTEKPKAGGFKGCL